MYGDELANDSLYSTTCSVKVHDEIPVFFDDYVQFNYKEMISVDGEIDDLKLIQELKDKWDRVERKEHVMSIVLKEKTYEEQIGLNPNKNLTIIFYLNLPKYIWLEHHIDFFCQSGYTFDEELSNA